MRTQLLSILLVTLFPAELIAGGFSRPNIVGPRAIGMGGATKAVVNDTTAIYHNPAGLTQVDSSMIQAGGGFLFLDVEFTPIQTNKTEQSYLTPTIVPYFGAAYRAIESLTLGVSVYNSFGTGARYDKDGVYHNPYPEPAVPYETQMGILEIVPAVAYRIIPQVAIGAGFRTAIASSSSKFKTPSFLGDIEGEFSTSGVDFGAVAGLLVEILPALKAGISYHSTVLIDSTGELDMGKDIGTFEIQSFKLSLPQSLGVGLSFAPIEGLLLAFDVDWYDYSWVDESTINIKEKPESENFIATMVKDEPVYYNYKDSFTFHYGGEYRLLDSLSLRAGYSFDTNSTPDKTLTRVNIDAEKQSIAIGAGYSPLDNLALDLAYEIIFAPGRTIEYNEDNFGPGHYSGRLHTLEILLSYKF